MKLSRRLMPTATYESTVSGDLGGVEGLLGRLPSQFQPDATREAWQAPWEVG